MTVAVLVTDPFSFDAFVTSVITAVWPAAKEPIAQVNVPLAKEHDPRVVVAET